jgi:acylpyruvate hydrolase
LRLVTFEYQNKTAVGALLDSSVIVSLAGAGRSLFSPSKRDRIVEHSTSMLALLSGGEDLRKLAQELIEDVRNAAQRNWEKLLGEAAVLEITAVRLLAPIPRPPKIVAVGLNYMDHCREQKVDAPDRPILFAKFSTSVIGPDEAISWAPSVTATVDYEAELAVIIGKRAKAVRAEYAQEYIAGYTALNDVSARDLQFGDGQWVRGKSLDTFCPLGPALVTPDEVPDPQDLLIQCQVNEKLLQDSSTSEMIFRIPELIAFITEGMTLEPGDIIATGTPHGVGVFRQPQIFLQDGDVVTVNIEKVGELRNRVSIVKPVV